MAQLALQPAVLHGAPCLIVECCGMQRGGDPIDDRTAELVSLRCQQPSRGVYKRVDCSALTLGGFVQCTRATSARENLLMRFPQRVTGAEQLAHRSPLRSDELVDRPPSRRRFLQPGYLGRGLTLTLAAQRARQLCPLGDEAIERQPVKVVDFHTVMVPSRPMSSTATGRRAGVSAA
jgi:hypothetical protein